MPTIIDELVVRLGLDSKGFKSEKNKVDKSLNDSAAVAEKAGARIKKSGKDSADGLAIARDAAIKFFAVVGGAMAIKRFVTDQIEANAALDRFSQVIGKSVESISAWSNAAELAGGSASGMQSAFELITKAQTDLQLTGQSGLVPYFSALGIAMSDANGKARDSGEIMLDLADRFSKMDKVTANNLGRSMGIDQGTMHLLLSGRKEVELMIARQRESNAVTKRQAEEATRLRASIVAGKQSFEAFGRELLSAVTPALEAVFRAFDSIGGWIRENGEFVTAFLGVLAGGLIAVGAAVTPINLAAAAVVALAGAIALLWQDYQTFKRGGETLIDWSKWEPGIKKAGEGVQWLREKIEDLVYRAIAGANVIASALDRDWDMVKYHSGEFVAGKPPERGGPPPVDMPSQAAGNDQRVVDYFRAQGWTAEQAAGIAANLKRESAYNPSAVGDNGKAYGVAQWHPDRQAEFRARFGKDIKGSSLEDQFAFVQYELTMGREKGAGERLRQTKTAADAAAAVSRYYERPSDREGEAAARGKLASSIFAGVPGASAAATGAGAMASAPAVNQTTNNSRTANIGEVKIITPATDAQGIARDMGRSIDAMFTNQANFGIIS